MSPGIQQPGDFAMPSTPALPDPPSSPVEQIPPAAVIRRRLAELARERALLRQLLRVADRRERTAEDAPGGSSDA
jgi:hypothetical protein